MDFNKTVFLLKYPHILILLLIIVSSYFIFASPKVILAVSSLGNAVYLGSFVSGMLFSLAVTAPLGAGFWSVATPGNIFVAALFAGLGTAIIDVLIFRSIKAVIHVKTADAHKSKLKPHVDKLMEHNVLRVIISSITFDLTGFLIGIPLPHNLHKVLISSVTRLKEWEVGVMSFIVFSIVALFFLTLRYTIPFALSLVGLA